MSRRAAVRCFDDLTLVKWAFALFCASACFVFVNSPARAQGDGPSFDCNKATNSNERMICADAGLRSRDLELAQAYFALLDVVPPSDEATIREIQRLWLADRQACGSDYQCTTRAYDTRTAQLEQQLTRYGGSWPSPEPQQVGPSYDCNRAGTDNERLICSVAELAALDLEMAQYYFALLDRVSGTIEQQMRDIQAAWLADRQACGGDFFCTANAYDTRIQQLETDLARY